MTTMLMVDLEQEDELDVECPRCSEIMSGEDGAECRSERCETFSLWAGAHQDDTTGELDPLP